VLSEVSALLCRDLLLRVLSKSCPESSIPGGYRSEQGHHLTKSREAFGQVMPAVESVKKVSITSKY
jgi:hypothetical protein